MPLSDADKAIRATGIGASEAWKIVEGHGAHDVFLRLVHPHLLVPEDESSGLPARKGQALEPLVAELYAERFGIPLDRLERCVTTLRHPKHSFILATPDAIVHGNVRRELLEIKCPTIDTRDDWGPDGSVELDAIPLKYRIQITIQMAVTGIHVANLAALIEGDRGIRVYPVEWDPELADLIVSKLSHFWWAHVIPQVDPPADSSYAASNYLRRKHPKSTGNLRAPSLEDVHLWETGEVLQGDAGLHRELLLVGAQMAALKQRKALLSNIAMERTGDADGVEGLWTWRLPKSGKGRTAWKNAAIEGRVPADVIAKHTKPPQRIFRVIGGDDDDNEET